MQNGDKYARSDADAQTQRRQSDAPAQLALFLLIPTVGTATCSTKRRELAPLASHSLCLPLSAQRSAAAAAVSLQCHLQFVRASALVIALSLPAPRTHLFIACYLRADAEAEPKLSRKLSRTRREASV